MLHTTDHHSSRFQWNTFAVSLSLSLVPLFHCSLSFPYMFYLFYFVLFQFQHTVYYCQLCTVWIPLQIVWDEIWRTMSLTICMAQRYARKCIERARRNRMEMKKEKEENTKHRDRGRDCELCSWLYSTIQNLFPWRIFDLICCVFGQKLNTFYLSVCFIFYLFFNSFCSTLRIGVSKQATAYAHTVNVCARACFFTSHVFV